MLAPALSRPRLAHPAVSDDAPAAAPTLELELRPIRERPGIYTAVLGGRCLVRSRQPLLDGARALLAEGVPPETMLATRHAGSAIVATRATVGEAARWTIEENDRDGLRRVRWNPTRHGPRRSGYGPSASDPALAGSDTCPAATRARFWPPPPRSWPVPRQRPDQPEPAAHHPPILATHVLAVAGANGGLRS
jgi:hypothetical protein